jgi:hypothetical protein
MLRFIKDQIIPDEIKEREENLCCEFKEIKGSKPIDRIKDKIDEYIVSFLNSKEGGKIYWGIRNDRVIVGINLTDRDRDELKKEIVGKFNNIKPPISSSLYNIKCHEVYPDKINEQPIIDLFVVEVDVVCGDPEKLYFTGSKKAFMKTECGRNSLDGTQINEEFRRRLQGQAEGEVRVEFDLKEKVKLDNSKNYEIFDLKVCNIGRVPIRNFVLTIIFDSNHPVEIDAPLLFVYQEDEIRQQILIGISAPYRRLQSGEKYKASTREMLKIRNYFIGDTEEKLILPDNFFTFPGQTWCYVVNITEDLAILRWNLDVENGVSSSGKIDLAKEFKQKLELVRESNTK